MDDKRLCEIMEYLKEKISYYEEKRKKCSPPYFSYEKERNNEYIRLQIENENIYNHINKKYFNGEYE